MIGRELKFCKFLGREYVSEGKADQVMPNLPGFQGFFISFARMSAGSNNGNIRYSGHGDALQRGLVDWGWFLSIYSVISIFKNSDLGGVPHIVLDQSP